MFSRFNEATHTSISTHTALADGTDEEELTLPGPEGGGRWSRSGKEILLPITDNVGTGTSRTLGFCGPDGSGHQVITIQFDTSVDSTGCYQTGGFND
jgi:hypothetical protein